MNLDPKSMVADIISYFKFQIVKNSSMTEQAHNFQMFACSAGREGIIILKNKLGETNVIVNALSR